MPNPLLAGVLMGMQNARQGKIRKENLERSLLPYRERLEKELRVKNALAKFLKELDDARTEGSVGSEPEEAETLTEPKGTAADRLGGYLGEQPAPPPGQVLGGVPSRVQRQPGGVPYNAVQQALMRGIAGEPAAAGALSTLANLQPAVQQQATQQALQKMMAQEAIKRKPLSLGQGQYLEYDETTGNWSMKGAARPLKGERPVNMGKGQWLENVDGKWVIRGTPRAAEGLEDKATKRVGVIDTKIAGLEKAKLSLQETGKITDLIIAANPALAAKMGGMIGQTVTPAQKKRVSDALDRAIRTLKQERTALSRFLPQIEDEEPETDEEEAGGETWEYDATGKRIK